jgi:hypothetical protein
MTASLGRALAVVAGVLLFAGAFATSFLLAGHEPTPHRLPLAVVGPPAAAAEAQRVADSGPGTLEVRRYASEAAARAAIADREVYGAVLARPGGRELLVASGASAMVAALLQARFAPARVTDVRPLAGGDPRGTSLNLLLLPMLIGSILVPTALKGAVPELGGARKLAALGIFAMLGGAGLAGLATAVDALPGPYLGVAAIIALTILAVSTVVAAIESSRLGIAGAIVGILGFLVIGNPASGAASARELLPGFWRTVGELLPPGAAVDAIRATAYFGGAGLTRPLLVLAAFATAGAAALLAAHRAPAAAPAAPAARAARATPAAA